MPPPYCRCGALTIAAGARSLETLVEPNWTDRSHLLALMAAVADRERAASLPDDDQLVAVARRHRLSPLLSVTAEDSLPPRLAEIVPARSADHCRAQHRCSAGPPKSASARSRPTAFRASCSRASPTNSRSIRAPARGRRRTSIYWFRTRNAAARSASSTGWGSNPRLPRRVLTTPTTMRWRGPERASRSTCTSRSRRSPAATSTIARSGRRPSRSTWVRQYARALRADHAAVFHALHMAIHHFGVPAIYLVDLSRLLPTTDDVVAAAGLARAWRCWRPFATATALAASLLPDWARIGHSSSAERRAILPAHRRWLRNDPEPAAPEQLRRKLQHFDTPRYALHYLVVQSRRNVRRRLIERRLRRRSARVSACRSTIRDDVVSDDRARSTPSSMLN